MHTALLALVALLCLPFSAQALQIGTPAPDFDAVSSDGRKVNLSYYRGQPVVLEWHNPECPFVKKHYNSGNMQALQKFARDNGVVWLAVNSGAPGREGSLSAEGAENYRETHKLSVDHYLPDHDGKIGRLYEATATPHMFVIDASGKLAYSGAIDDKPTADPADIPGARNHVRAALNELLTGKPVSIASTQAYGCSVKYAK